VGMFTCGIEACKICLQRGVRTMFGFMFQSLILLFSFLYPVF